MDGFTKIRNGIVEHINDGKLSPFDLGIYTYLQLRADWTTGIVKTCAASIAYGFSDASLTKAIQRSLHRLRDRHYINYPEGYGKRGRYEILIHKYRVAVGRLSGMELNAWKNGFLVKPEYQPWGGERAVGGQSCGGDAAVLRPIQDFKEVEDVKDKISHLKSESEIPEGLRKRMQRDKEMRLAEARVRGFELRNGQIVRKEVF
jgi:hypothetical protein